MLIESRLDNNYDRLHEFVNQEDLWKRQVRVFKEYKWSQQAVIVLYKILSAFIKYSDFPKVIIYLYLFVLLKLLLI